MLDASIRSKELDYKVKSSQGLDGSVNTDHKCPIGFLANFETGNELEGSTFLEELKTDLSEADILDMIPPEGLSGVSKLPLLVMLDALFGGGSAQGSMSTTTDSNTSSSKHDYSSYLSMGKYAGELAYVMSSVKIEDIQDAYLQGMLQCQIADKISLLIADGQITDPQQLLELVDQMKELTESLSGLIENLKNALDDMSLNIQGTQSLDLIADLKNMLKEALDVQGTPSLAGLQNLRAKVKDLMNKTQKSPDLSTPGPNLNDKLTLNLYESKAQLMQA
jgi:hypothetical protein